MSTGPAGTCSSRCGQRPRRGPAKQFQRVWEDFMKITSVEPWLVKASTSYWGEYLFVEVKTDEGVSGWGEITSTTRIANRALCAILKQVSGQIAGEDPIKIERLWHKLFRSFTYMGSRGAACE